MKTSNKILLGGGAALVIALRAAVGAAVAPTPASPEVSGGASTGPVTLTPELSAFSAVESQGAWELSIRRADAASLVVVVPEYLRSGLVTRVRGDTLELGFRPGVRIRAGTPTPRAEIAMPALEEVASSGAVDATLSGFSQDRLAIALTGGSKLQARECQVRELSLEVSGVGQVDLRDAPAHDADVRISGAAAVTLTMTGGELRAEVGGASSLTYYGDVSRRRIEQSGIATVRQGE